MSTIGLYSLKGGVGKTTTAVNLAYLAAREGDPTLVWDLDPQGAASFYLGASCSKKTGGKRILEKGLRKLCVATGYPGLEVLPASPSHGKLDLLLSRKKKPAKGIGRRLGPLQREFTWVFIDCPTNFSLLAENLFRSADLLLVPLIPTTLCVRTHRAVVAHFRKKGLDETRILPFFSMVQGRKLLHRDTMEGLWAEDERFLRTPIPSLAEIEKMGLRGRPYPAYRPTSVATRAYQALWRECRQRIAGGP